MSDAGGGGGPSWQILALAVVLGAGGGIGTRLMYDPRPDPWTGEDAARSRKVIEDVISDLKRELKLDQRELEHRLRSSRPPQPTRRRIEAVEKAIQRLEREAGRDWDPASNQFSPIGLGHGEPGTPPTMQSADSVRE